MPLYQACSYGSAYKQAAIPQALLQLPHQATPAIPRQLAYRASHGFHVSIHGSILAHKAC